jgi:hypothetical protein
MIAISYRREDSLPIAGRLYDRLQAKFGKQNVFMDFDSIPPGVDFRDQIKQIIERSKLVIAMIGPNWLGEQSATSRRIDDPMDFVRLEIAYALKRGIPVIPVLINSAPMPKPEKLPPDIEGLAFRNAVVLDTGIDFHHHADRLITGICGLVDSSPTQDLGVGSEKIELIQPDASGAVTVSSASRKILKVLAAGFSLAAVTVLMVWVFAEKQRVQGPGKSAEARAVASPSSSSTLPARESSPNPIPMVQPEPTTSEEQAPEPATFQSRERARASPVISNSLWYERIGEFIKQFVQSNSSPDSLLTASFYAPNAEIFDEGSKNLDSIRRDIQAYNERWPTRRNEIRGQIQLVEKVDNQEYGASFQQDYYVENPARREWIKGAVAIDLEIKVIEGLPKISSIKQTMLKREKGSLAIHLPSLQSTKSKKLFVGTWEGVVNLTANRSSLGKSHQKFTIDESETEVAGGGWNTPRKGWIHSGSRSLEYTGSGRDAGIYESFTLNADGKSGTYSASTCSTCPGGGIRTQGILRKVK